MTSAQKSMVRAVWNDEVIAQSDRVVMDNGDLYFPQKSVNSEFLEPSSITTRCPSKGEAQYFNLQVNGKRVLTAAWTYTNPKAKAKKIRNHIAFRGGVEIVE